MLLTLISLQLVKISTAVFVLNNDWIHGFDHPLQGWDHLLTMIAVGIWAAQLRGQAIWMLPVTFVSVMSLGGLAGAASYAVPNAEIMILLSGMVFSVFIVRKVHFTTRINVLIVAFFAFFHGYAHGQEISASASLISYTLGFVFATSVLHCAGIATARLVAITFAFFLGSNASAQETEVTAKDATETTVKAKSKTSNNDTLELTEMVVTAGRAKGLIGIAASASQGEVSQAQFEYRPLSRNGELLEVIPGVLATQHSGSGKTNQYFLRGFNLDHGTDFTTYVDGVPMNLPTHAHGQGYMDVNSIIPELVKNIEYGKGPYYAEVGDFSAAGYSKMFSMDKLPKGIFKFTAGQYDYYRTLIANSNKVGSGDLLYAGEFNFYNGVWQQPEGSKKFNGMLRYTLNKDNWGSSVFAKAYTNSWTATNQIPQAAVDNGTLGLYGTMDPTDGGNTNRYSLSSNLWNKGDNWKNDANIYALYYDVDLYSNFTGYLENPVLGDQIHQFEHRVQTGGNVEHTRYNKRFGFDMDNTVGLQFRYDNIMGLGLDHTANRQYLNTVSHSDVSQATAGIYFKNQTYWLEKFRTITGVRGDYINNDVTQLDNTLHAPLVNAANSGTSHKARVSPKLSFIIGPWYDTEYFVNAGYGYHSNDARGTVLHLNPVDGSSFADGNPTSPVSPLAWSRGAETGIRSNFIKGLNSTIALWFLESSQELVFVGDAGTTEVNGKSHRYGVELTNYYKPTDWLTVDADFAFTSAHFVTTPEGETNSYIPNSVGMVITMGATVVAPNGLFGTLRLRHFGDVPLDESGTLWAGSTNIVNMSAGYQHKAYKVELDLFNVLGSVANDIAYAYDNAYPAGASGQFGIMKHPVEPRMVRGTITLNF
ncbi:MAG: HupE/UreJ family protein [Methylococcales bacterium]|nr:HupE/UreJ family protein [Methylococcales bacterium]